MRPSYADLSELLAYERDTGEFRWKRFMSPRALVGNVAGTIYANGYRMIGIRGTAYGAHRIAWCLVTGQWPTHNIDHLNGDRSDNRFANLRDAPQTTNSQNQRRPHVDKVSCQLLGATWDKMWGNWKAQLTYQKRTVYLWRFKTAEEAHAAYLEGKRRIHQGCTL